MSETRQVIDSGTSFAKLISAAGVLVELAYEAGVRAGRKEAAAAIRAGNISERDGLALPVGCQERAAKIAEGNGCGPEQ